MNRAARGQSAALTLPQKFEEGVRLYQAGKLREAERLLLQVIKKAPGHAETNHCLALLYQSQKKLAKAEQHAARAVKAAPQTLDHSLAHGKILQALNRTKEALEAYINVLKIDSAHVDAHYSIITQRQKHPDAPFDEDVLASAIDHDKLAMNYKKLALIIWERGQKEECLALLEQSAEINPKDGDTLARLAILQNILNRNSDALPNILKAIEIDPDNDEFFVYFASILRFVKIRKADPQLEKTLDLFLDKQNISLKSAFSTWAKIIRLRPETQALGNILEQDDDDSFTNAFTATTTDNTLIPALKDPFFIKGMRKLIMAAPDWENMARRLRKQLCMMGESPDDLKTWEPVLLAMAGQCFFNEYVFSFSAEENKIIDELKQKLADAPDSCPDGTLIPLTALVSSYHPLFEWCSDDLERALTSRIEGADKPEWADFLKIQLLNHKTEQKLKQGIPALGSIADEVSNKVRAQYEENPYPRWETTTTVASWLSPHGVIPEAQTRNYQVLVAGCGTGQHPITTATGLPNSDILAIDLSLASLAYARRKSEEYGFKRITYKQADILDLEQAGIGPFDVIESAGVLHHMHDPMAGWQVLTNLLKPGGYMRIGLYSEIARKHVVTSREEIAKKGITGSAADIRAYREELKAMEPDDRRARTLRSYDFYTTSVCRDLLFHVQEHRFTIPQIQDCLERLGLTFIEFEMSDGRVIEEFEKANPNPRHKRDLARWEAFEQRFPHTFAGMYQFICRKKRDKFSRLIN